MFKPFTFNLGGKLVTFQKPAVMGILNVTPNSFFDGGLYLKEDSALRQVEEMVNQGASFVDIGGCSTKPGSVPPSVQEEIERVIPVITKVREHFPSVFISVDTYRTEVLIEAAKAGVHLINDVSAGSLSAHYFETVAKLGLPYCLMHMQGSPENMQKSPAYQDVVTEVNYFFSEKLALLHRLGVKDIMLDPGFGFGKTIAHNYQMLKHLDHFSIHEKPILVGVSRKSMICKALEIAPSDALNGTTALNMLALNKGASILRVHDVKEAVECVKLHVMLEDSFRL
ncbi:MAG: dihydropteroate synthase [Luteibaculaceae bacterium]